MLFIFFLIIYCKKNRRININVFEKEFLANIGLCNITTANLRSKRINAEKDFFENDLIIRGLRIVITLKNFSKNGLLAENNFATSF